MRESILKKTVLKQTVESAEIEVYEDLSEINDSLLMFSDTLIASYKNNANNIVVNYVVRGDVKIYFNGDCFRYLDDFPEELKELIKNGTLYEDERVDVANNNWFNMEYYEEGEFVWDDVVAIEGMSPENIADDIQNTTEEVIKVEKVSQLREKLEEYLNGLVICDCIKRDDLCETLDDFDNWVETAEIGDTYYYEGIDYTI